MTTVLNGIGGGVAAATGAVRILDLKGQYHGTTLDQPADPELYKRYKASASGSFGRPPVFRDDETPKASRTT